MKEQGSIAHTKCLPISLCTNRKLYISEQTLTDFTKNYIDDTFYQIPLNSMLNILA